MALMGASPSFHLTELTTGVTLPDTSGSADVDGTTSDGYQVAFGQYLDRPSVGEGVRHRCYNPTPSVTDDIDAARRVLAEEGDQAEQWFRFDLGEPNPGQEAGFARAVQLVATPGPVGR